MTIIYAVKRVGKHSNINKINRFSLESFAIGHFDPEAFYHSRDLAESEMDKLNESGGEYVVREVHVHSTSRIERYEKTKRREEEDSERKMLANRKLQKDFADLLAEAKANPDKYDVVTNENGTVITSKECKRF
jgi:hypothetical protein